MSDETRASDEGTQAMDFDELDADDPKPCPECGSALDGKWIGERAGIVHEADCSWTDYDLVSKGHLNALEAELSALRAENEHLTAERDEAARWREVVLDALVTHWELRGEHESDAHMAVADLMAAGSRWALDPAISEDAAKLRDTYAGALALANADAEAQEAILVELDVMLSALTNPPAPSGFAIPVRLQTVAQVMRDRIAPVRDAHRARIAPAGDAAQPQAGGAT